VNGTPGGIRTFGLAVRSRALLAPLSYRGIAGLAGRTARTKRWRSRPVLNRHWRLERPRSSPLDGSPPPRRAADRLAARAAGPSCHIEVVKEQAQSRCFRRKILVPHPGPPAGRSGRRIRNASTGKPSPSRQTKSPGTLRCIPGLGGRTIAVARNSPPGLRACPPRVARRLLAVACRKSSSSASSSFQRHSPNGVDAPKTKKTRNGCAIRST
jgi:hypothetical protein